MLPEFTSGPSNSPVQGGKTEPISPEEKQIDPQRGFIGFFDLLESGQTAIQGQLHEKRMPYQDVIQGALYDKNGLAFVLFTRFREGILNIVRLMAETPDGKVLVVYNVSTKGIVFRKFLLVLKDASGHQIQFVPKGIRDASENATAKCFAVVSLENVMFRGCLYMPEDFWAPLSERILAEAMQLTWK